MRGRKRKQENKQSDELNMKDNAAVFMALVLGICSSTSLLRSENCIACLSPLHRLQRHCDISRTIACEACVRTVLSRGALLCDIPPKKKGKAAVLCILVYVLKVMK